MSTNPQTLKEWLDDRKIGQTSLANKLGCSSSLISNIAHGRVGASFKIRSKFFSLFPGYDVIEMRLSEEEVKMAKEQDLNRDIVYVSADELDINHLMKTQDKLKNKTYVYVVSHQRVNPRVFKSKEEAKKWILDYIMDNMESFGFEMKYTEIL